MFEAQEGKWHGVQCLSVIYSLWCLNWAQISDGMIALWVLLKSLNLIEMESSAFLLSKYIITD